MATAQRGPRCGAGQGCEGKTTPHVGTAFTRDMPSGWVASVLTLKAGCQAGGRLARLVGLIAASPGLVSYGDLWFQSRARTSGSQ